MIKNHSKVALLASIISIYLSSDAVSMDPDQNPSRKGIPTRKTGGGTTDPTLQYQIEGQNVQQPFNPSHIPPHPTTVENQNQPEEDDKADALQAVAQVPSASTSLNVASLEDIMIPEIARGYEEIYRRFVMGKLIYKPDPNSDNGKIELPIRALANPLEGTFDLSCCGDAGKKHHLSIATGYRKGKKAENAYKVEVWITPRFLIEKELQGSANHFTGIMGMWSGDAAPVGIFFTDGNWDNSSYCDYVTDLSVDYISSNNLHNISKRASPTKHKPRPTVPERPTHNPFVKGMITHDLQKFRVHF